MVDTNDYQRYYILASSSIRKTFIFHAMLSMFELHFLLKQSIVTMYNMVPFEFANIILSEMEFGITKTNYFQSMEILYGKSLSDLFLKNPTRIKYALH